MRILIAPTPSSASAITEENTMHVSHQPTPLCGPVPDGLMRVSTDIPIEMFAALCFAATHP